jgi:hypothetical protein
VKSCDGADSGYVSLADRGNLKAVLKEYADTCQHHLSIVVLGIFDEHLASGVIILKSSKIFGPPTFSWTYSSIVFYIL